MTHLMAELDTCTEEELQQALAGLLAHARGEVLSDSEVQDFWHICREIQQRSGNAA